MIWIFNVQPVKILQFLKTLLTRKQARWPHLFIAFLNVHIMNVDYASFKKSLMVEQFQGNYLKLYWCLQLKVTISNKIVETNRVTSENKTNKTPPPSPQFKVRCFFSAGSSNSGTTLHGWDGGGGGWERVEVGKTSERPLMAKCLN